MNDYFLRLSLNVSKLVVRKLVVRNYVGTLLLIHFFETTVEQFFESDEHKTSISIFVLEMVGPRLGSLVLFDL